jgi:hypothetical protein
MKTDLQLDLLGSRESPTIEAGNRENVNSYNVKAYHFLSLEYYPIFYLRFNRLLPVEGKLSPFNGKTKRLANKAGKMHNK